uniref:Putative krotzkopf verkehrt n=1 Tax=Ixodes ricinus TaxID=34613 RepID=V5H665_IXORI
MLNALFVLLVFALQVSRAHVYVPWPLEVKTNITLIKDQIIITTKSLRLEPIGLIIAAFFAFVMIIQFVGMICHRFHTFSHILASVELSCCKQKVGDPKDDGFIGQDVIHAAKRMQRLKSIDGDDASTTESDESRQPEDRKTTRRLERRRKRGAKTGTLDAAFERRCKSYSADGLGGMHPMAVFNHFSDSTERRGAAEIARELGNHRMKTLDARDKHTAAVAAALSSGAQDASGHLDDRWY